MDHMNSAPMRFLRFVGLVSAVQIIMPLLAWGFIYAAYNLWLHPGWWTGWALWALAIAAPIVWWRKRGLPAQSRRRSMPRLRG